MTACLAHLGGWADVGNLHVDEAYRRRGVATWLVGQAADWLRLARVDRLLDYAWPEEEDRLALLRQVGFLELTRTTRGWSTARPGRSIVRPMRAAVRTRYGPPEVVRVTEVERPSVGDGEVLVKVHATTVNRTDCGVRAAKPFIYRFFLGPVRPRLTVLGNEFAGEVEAVGAAVTAFQPGDRVFGWRSERFGAHAEYLAMPADASLATIPAGLTYEEAAPSTEGAHYALTAIRAARVGRGHDVLVYGATGAIGSAAVQLLAHLGATVTAVCGTAHLELVRGLGAARVIDYTAEDFTRDGQTYDVVLDAVGKSSFGRCRRLLRPGGSYLSTDLGPLSQNPFLALVTPVFRGRRVRFPIPRQDPEQIRHLRGLLESDAFRPLVDRRYRLDEIVDAYRYVETGTKLGNVVVSVVPPGA